MLIVGFQRNWIDTYLQSSKCELENIQATNLMSRKVKFKHNIWGWIVEAIFGQNRKVISDTILCFSNLLHPGNIIKGLD